MADNIKIIDIRHLPRQKRGSIDHAVRNFGRSRMGAPLEVFGPGAGQPRCLVVAGQHGTEPEGTVLLSSVLRMIPRNRLAASAVTSLNPDGIARGTRGNSAGVDLNRNFPTANWSPEPVCHNWFSDEPMDTVLSPGTSPGSEPETPAIIKLVEEISPEIIISIHAPLGCIDDPRLSVRGNWLSGETGLPLVGSIGYATPGSFGTWAEENNIHLITFELPIGSIESHRKNYGPVLFKILTGKFK